MSEILRYAQNDRINVIADRMSPPNSDVDRVVAESEKPFPASGQAKRVILSEAKNQLPRLLITSTVQPNERESSSHSAENTSHHHV
jgi:hypothetical protein